MKKVLVAVLVILALTILFVASENIPAVRRFTDRAVQTISLVGLALFVAGLVFVIGHRLGASTERSHVSAPTTNTFPATYQPAAPQILMLPPAQSSLPREVWERPLSSNQGANLPESGAPRKIDWSVVS
jgi:hypothetical protein